MLWHSGIYESRQLCNPYKHVTALKHCTFHKTAVNWAEILLGFPPGLQEHMASREKLTMTSCKNYPNCAGSKQFKRHFIEVWNSYRCLISLLKYFCRCPKLLWGLTSIRTNLSLPGLKKFLDLLWYPRKAKTYSFQNLKKLKNSITQIVT